MHPSVSLFNIALLIALASAVFRAGSSSTVRALAHHSYSVLTMLFYYFLIGTLLAGLTVPFNYHTVAIFPWEYLIGISVVAALYQIFLTTGYTLASVRLLTPLTYLSVVFAVIADWFLWQQIPSIWMFVGMGFVILGIVLVLIMGREIVNSAHTK